jgi:hypothetical protein
MIGLQNFALGFQPASTAQYRRELMLAREMRGRTIPTAGYRFSDRRYRARG